MDEMDEMNETGEMDDLELITMAVNGHLSPERLAEVSQRLKTDAAFRDLAAPVLLTWSVPPRLEPEPRSIEELERDWDAFAKKAGIGRYRLVKSEPSGPAGPADDRTHTGRGGGVRRRGWWLAGLLLVVAGTAATIAYNASRRVAGDPEAAALDSMSTPVAYQAGWMPLMDGIEVQLDPGSSLRRAHQRMRGMRHVLLQGTARFRIPDIDSAETSLRTQSLVVETSVGFVTASNAELTVSTRGDTTDVQVHLLPLGGRQGADAVTLSDVVETTRMGQLLFMAEQGRMRLVRGRDPERLPASR